MSGQVATWQVRSAYRGPLSTPLEGIARVAAIVQRRDIQAGGATGSSHAKEESKELSCTWSKSESEELSESTPASDSSNDFRDEGATVGGRDLHYQMILKQVRRCGAYWLAERWSERDNF